MQNAYLDIIIVGSLLFVAIILIWFILNKTLKEPSGFENRPNIYDNSYTSGKVASGKGPLPIGMGRKEKDRR